MSATGLIDADALARWLVEQRWFASKAREVAGLRVLESVELDTEPEPRMALALVEVAFGPGTHELYHLPLGLRHGEVEVVGEGHGRLARFRARDGDVIDPG